MNPAQSMQPDRESASGAIIDYARSLDCIHCGLCLNTCPTYRITGAEPSSPRGRIHLMRAVAEDKLAADDDFAEELDFCLVCRHCESVCPAGVEFGAMMELARDGLSREKRSAVWIRLLRWLGFRVVLPNRFALRAAATLLGLAQATGLVRLARFFGARGKALAGLPAVPRRAERRPLEPRTPATLATTDAGTPTALILAGCVMPELLGRVNRATQRLVNTCGFECRSPESHVCCGALHAHNGDLEGARRLARQTIELFEAAQGSPDDPVVVNSAGCGAHMKEYGRILSDDDTVAKAGGAPWTERAQSFARRVVDLSEFLTTPEANEALRGRLTQPQDLALPIAYDDPCHLCHGQSIRDEPRVLLDTIPDLERVDLPNAESCCGSAGIYSILRPNDSNELFDAKLTDLQSCNARTLITANPGCQLQWQAGLARAGANIQVLHLAEALDRALTEQPNTR